MIIAVNKVSSRRIALGIVMNNSGRCLVYQTPIVCSNSIATTSLKTVYRTRQKQAIL